MHSETIETGIAGIKLDGDLFRTLEGMPVEDLEDWKNEFEAFHAELQVVSVEDLYEIANEGYRLFEQGRLREARGVFEGLLLYSPRDPYFHLVLASIDRKQGRSESALGRLERVLEVCPGDPFAVLQMAEIKLGLSQMTDPGLDPGQRTAMASEALDHLTRLARDESNHPAAMRARQLLADGVN